MTKPDDANLILGPLVGGLKHNSVNLWGRADGDSILHAWIALKPDLSDAILAGTSLPLVQENGFAGVVPVKRLQPLTDYYFTLSFSDRLPDPGTYPHFRTLPEPGDRIPFNFAIGSCFNPRVDGGGIFEVLESASQSLPLSFVLLVGDQVYADDHRFNSLGKAAFSVDEYRSVYAHTWSHPLFRRTFSTLPVFMIMDDHEVDDDWRWLDPSRTRMYIPWWDRISRTARGCEPDEVSMNTQKVRNALQAYWEHQAMHAPAQEYPLELTSQGQYSLSPGDDGSLAFSFTAGAAAFFVMDTRTMRSRALWPWKQKSATILGEGQWHALESWLISVKDTHPVKFLVSSSSVLFDMWLDITRDRWSGYRMDRDRLLRFLAAERIEGVHILSGDLHSSHALRIDLTSPGQQPVRVWEFCSSPLDQKTNWLAKTVYKKLRHPLVTEQVCEFILDKNNFGVVQVKYGQDGHPQVGYKLYGENGQILASI